MPLASIDTDFVIDYELDPSADDVATMSRRIHDKEKKVPCSVPPGMHGKRWFRQTINAFEGFLTLKPNWDSYGAKPIDARNLESALSILYRIMREDTPIPFPVATSSGSVQFEWHERGIDLEIEVLGPDEFDVLYEDLRTGEEEWEGVVTLDDPGPLFDVIQKLSERN